MLEIRPAQGMARLPNSEHGGCGKKDIENTDTRSYDIIGSVGPNLSTDNTGAGHQAMSPPGYRSSQAPMCLCLASLSLGPHPCPGARYPQ